MKKGMQKCTVERGILVILYPLLSCKNVQDLTPGVGKDRKRSNGRREEGCVSEVPEATPAGPNHIFKGKNVQQNPLKDPQQSISTLAKTVMRLFLDFGVLDENAPDTFYQFV